MKNREAVRTVAEHAGQMSGGWFGVDIGSDLGNGVRYMSMSDQTVWLGTAGAMHACSYFLGAIDTLNPGEAGDLPEAVNAVRERLLIAGGWSEEWAGRGRTDAQSRLRHLASRDSKGPE
jgi:hypothetical protein